MKEDKAWCGKHQQRGCIECVRNDIAKLQKTIDAILAALDSDYHKGEMCECGKGRPGA